MKYIDAEKLIAEIRKLRSESCISESDDYYEYAKSRIIDIIESLQQDKPDVDLEKEIRSVWEKCNPVDEGMGVESVYMHIEAFDIIVRHFYELGNIARKEEAK